MVLRTKQGDVSASETLFRRHLGAAYAVALAKMRNAADAEDVTQDALVSALRGLDGCREPERFAAWLMQIVRNAASDLRRREMVRTATPLDQVPVLCDPARTDHEAERADLRAALTTALCRLTHLQREVVLLHDMEGLRHAEIGERLGISEGAARAHLFTARGKLRIAMAPYHPGMHGLPPVAGAA